MAPDRIAVGRLAAFAAAIALVVSGCGGGGSSTTATTAAAPGPSTAKATPSGSASSGGAEGGEQGGATSPGDTADAPHSGKKHPPIEMPKGKPEKGFTKAQRNAGPIADIEVALPDGLTATNTCKGKNVSPAISWHNVPPGASELAIFAMNVEPVDGKLHFAWAMAGIDPSSSGLKAGEVPAGAVLGRNSAGMDKYSLCPSGSDAENYIFTLYAVNGGKTPKKGFDPLELRSQVSQASEKAGFVGATVGG